MMPPARSSSQLLTMPARRPTPTVLCLPPACATGLPYQPASLRSRSPVQNNTPGARPPAKRGRPKNTKPHAIPRLPRSNSNIPPARLREIKADQAIKLNNAASARWRAKQTASRQRNQALLAALQARHSGLIERERGELAKSTQLRKFLLDRLDLNCTFCKQALLLQGSALPMVVVKMEEPDTELKFEAHLPAPGDAHGAPYLVGTAPPFQA